jgi:capsular polysaccharide biosynthesis protein
MYQQEVEGYDFLRTGTKFKRIRSLLLMKRKEKGNKPKTFEILAELIDLDEHKFKSFFKPVVIEEVIVPEPSWSNRAEAYEVHKLFFDRVTDVVLENVDITKSNVPLYFSRTQLNKSFRQLQNEEKVEEYIRSIGGKIVYPEKLSFEELIILCNKHKLFIGCIGASFLTLLFVKSSDLNTICLSEPRPRPNFFMMDKLKDINSNYINCMTKVDPNIRGKKGNNFILDHEKAIFYLNEILG